MKIIIGYELIMNEYEIYSKNFKPSMVTTQYNCGDIILTTLSTSLDLNKKISNFISSQNGKRKLKKIEYFSNPINRKDSISVIDKYKFNLKLKSYDKSTISVIKEIIHDYEYIDKLGKKSKTQIVIFENDNAIMSASVEFNNLEEYSNFITPSWLDVEKTL